MKKGIDVSEAQGLINWKAVKNSGQVDFAIIRSGLGWTDGAISTRRDNYYERNVDECIDNGIPYGIYHYSYCLKPENAKREAEYIVKLLKDKKPDMGVWLDIEANAQIPLGRDKITQIAVDEIDVIKAAGYDVGVYSYLYWLNTYFDMSKINAPVWVAQVGVPAPTYNGDFVMWQNSWTGTVDGIQGDVDTDIYYGAETDVEKRLNELVQLAIKIREDFKNGCWNGR